MSRGLSWRQKVMLVSISHQMPRTEFVAWCDIDNGPYYDGAYDPFTRQGRWNIEQTIRRSLHSLKRRGLVELRYGYFMPDEHWNGLFNSTVWSAVTSDRYMPGEGRLMISARLTTAGEAELAAEIARLSPDVRASSPTG